MGRAGIPVSITFMTLAVLAVLLVGLATGDTEPTGVPSFAPGDRAMTVCVDSVASRSAYLTGEETVGQVVATLPPARPTPVKGPTPTATPTPVYALVSDGGETTANDYALFNIDSTGNITVNDAGADDESGLDKGRPYSFYVEATHGVTDLSSRVHVAVTLLQTPSANNDDGVCP